MVSQEFNVYAKEVYEQKLKDCREMLNELYDMDHCRHLPMWQKVVGAYEAHEKDLEEQLKRFER